jgi:exodeoxyribonuclease-5
MAYAVLLDFLEGRSDAGLAVLRGYAGTGKTFLVGKLIHDLDPGMTVAVAAPTNKAVKVLREKILEAGGLVAEEPLDNIGHLEERTRVAFGSIHSLLGLQLTEREDGSQECKSARNPSLHKYDVVIIDECSMIGADLFRQVVLCKRQTRVLFVGDPAQLPPVEANEAESPTFHQVSLQVMLTEVVRQAADNPIIQLSLLLRRAIESGQRADITAMAAVLPSLHEHPQAALVPGDAHTVMNFALYEINAGRDARVLAFTNEAVNRYNRAIHEALHGPQAKPFVVGERVILHSQCDALKCEDDGQITGLKTMLITSEEAVIQHIQPKKHPQWDLIPAHQVFLKRDTGEQVAVYLPDDPANLEREIGAQFGQWRELKAKADAAYASARRIRDDELRLENQRAGDEFTTQAKAASGKAWALRRAFAPLRHAYALTTHKSQGSTFDTAIVDLNDLDRMRSAFAFNRGLYVAATRPRSYLAVVVA